MPGAQSASRAWPRESITHARGTGAGRSSRERARTPACCRGARGRCPLQQRTDGVRLTGPNGRSPRCGEDTAVRQGARWRVGPSVCRCRRARLSMASMPESGLAAASGCSTCCRISEGLPAAERTLEHSCCPQRARSKSETTVRQGRANHQRQALRNGQGGARLSPAKAGSRTLGREQSPPAAPAPRAQPTSPSTPGVSHFTMAVTGSGVATIVGESVPADRAATPLGTHHASASLKHKASAPWPLHPRHIA